MQNFKIFNCHFCTLIFALFIISSSRSNISAASDSDVSFSNTSSSMPRYYHAIHLTFKLSEMGCCLKTFRSRAGTVPLIKSAYADFISGEQGEYEDKTPLL